MKFKIPESLGVFTVEALQGLRTEAATEYKAIFSSVTADTVTDEQINDLQALRTFGDAVDAEIATRGTRAASFAALPGGIEAAPVEAPTETPAPETPAAPLTAGATPTIAQLAGGSATGVTVTTTVETPQVPAPRYASLVAAADVPGYSNGQELNDLVDVTKAFLAKARGFGGNNRIQNAVALIKREYPEEFQVDDTEAGFVKVMKVADESRLPGGSLLASQKIRSDAAVKAGKTALTAAGGWCAPSETVYSTCFQTAIDGLADFPEVQATRGGVRHNTGLDWTSVYGGGNILASANGVTGFWNRTEAQVIAGSPAKDTISVACPSFTDTRLGVTGLTLTSPILTNRGYPEFVATFTQGALAVHAHQLNALKIQAVVTGSTAVTLTGIDPWASDGTVTSNVLSAVEMAIVDLKYRLRLPQSATLEIILPYWVLAQMRADLSRRTAMDLEAMAVTDAQIMNWFSIRNARVQFVYDWQDAFTVTGAGTVGNATAPQLLPTSLQFLVYPAGTWVMALQDVITLHAVYDSTLLATNMVTQLFTEDGWAALQMCPVSRVYTVPICPSGATTATQVVDCVTP